MQDVLFKLNDIAKEIALKKDGKYLTKKYIDIDSLLLWECNEENINDKMCKKFKHIVSSLFGYTVSILFMEETRTQ
ncbi:15076_t:CDS:2 [Acaulospora morrowiae]|uniref:15076_t:CDS:1 n=1 Tax=Acaulospora morrowiae TaxID=94023 RepID=A0A9N8YV93_9GLOM|nr:15076_t:CDS:2 [Acaulospora morrowiae]